MARYDCNETVWQYSPTTLTHGVRVPPPAAPWFYNTEVDSLNPHDGRFNQYDQRGPPLELSGNPVYMKSNVDTSGCNSLARPIVNISNTQGVPNCQCSGKLSAIMSSGEIGCCMPDLPPSYMELKSPCGCSSCRNGSQIYGESYSTYPTCHLQDGFQTAVGGSMGDQPSYHQMVYKMPRSSSRSVSVREDPADKELERLGHKEAPEPRSQISTAQGQSSDFTYAASSKLESQRSPFQNHSPPGYMERTETMSTEFTDKSVIEAMEREHNKTQLSVMENSQDKGQGLGYEHFVDDQARKNFHNIMEEDESIVMCKRTCHPGPLTNTETEAGMASNKTPMSAVLCDVMVSTEPVEYMSASTQTEYQATVERGINTEVYKFDLDYLAEELIRLKMAQDVRDQKDKMTSPGPKLRKECDIQRAQRVDLCILALQYNMCRQHCWRLYSTCIELSPIHGDMSQYWPKEPPLNIVSTLQKLDSDYNQMRDRILAGVPLERLAALSVDHEKIITGTSYIPQLTTKQIIGEVLGNVPSWSSQEMHTKSSKGSLCTTAAVPNTVECQDGQEQRNAAHQHRETSGKSSTAVALIPQQPVPSACKSEGKQPSACKEQSPGEIWYDATEDLNPAVITVSAELLKESASEEANRTVLCVSNLPSEVTESDVMLLFEKYAASEVSICTLNNNLRSATVTFNGSKSADEAVTSLNGCSLQGQTLHVECISGASVGCQSKASASIGRPEDSTGANKSQTTETDSASPGEKALSLSVKNNEMPECPSALRICVSPTAKGTCVPQHFGTMASLDILIPELTQLHPDVGRQRIVEALIELRARHRGALNRLPLGTVRQMTSDLLTRPANPS